MDGISETGFWTQGGTFLDQNHYHDELLSKGLIEVFRKWKSTRVIDLGCGKGTYVRDLRKHGFDASGYDGNPFTTQFDHCFVADLTKDLNIEPSNTVLCLEVGEHVPQQFEVPLIQNMDRCVTPGGRLVLSWAVEGQHGHGHVNCRNNDYVIQTFQNLGYTYDRETTKYLREKSSFHYFKNTIMVFLKSSSR